jgi:uncharacterized membrane protein YjgN (DUF898 family)
MAQNLGNCSVTLTGEIQNKKRENRSCESVYFGRPGKYFGLMICMFLLSIVPIFGLPNAICITERWNCAHTRIVGMPLQFEGKAMELLGKMIVWLFFTIITVGIYGLVMLPVRYKQWIAKNTVFGPVA